ncbi:MAG: SEL1-like repeat protein [Ghiorsea sp.]
MQVQFLFMFFVVLMVPFAAFATPESCNDAYSKKAYNQAYARCIVSARQGDIPSAVKVSFMYKHGLGTKKSYAKSVYWLQESAKAGVTSAMNGLGLAYMNGQGLKQNDAEALVWFRKADQLGDRYAYQNAARLCSEGRALSSYCQTASTQWNMSVMYRNDSLGFAKNKKKEFVHALNAAKMGHGAAMGQVGYAYANGQGIDQSYQLAAKWYEKAIKKGNASAMNNFGILYDQGLGVVRDPKKAFALYKQAAERGDVAGMFDLAWAHHYGNGTVKNAKKAVSWYRKAKELGSRSASEKLIDLSKLEPKSPELFGINLAWAMRDNMRYALKQAGAQITREDKQYYYDTYDSSSLLAGSEELSLGYVIASDALVEAEYKFPASTHEGGVDAVKVMVSSKYGEPTSVQVNDKTSELTYTWKVGVIDITLRRTWPSATVFLSFVHPTQKLLMDREVNFSKRKMSESNYQSQYNAF